MSSTPHINITATKFAFQFNDITVEEVDSNGFNAVRYEDILPTSAWVDAPGGAAPDIVTYTIGGISYNFKSFDGGNTTEAMTNAFEILHGVDINSLNAETIALEIHHHGFASTTGAGNVKIFFDLVYFPINAAPITWGTFSVILTVSANQLYYHKVVGVELPKPSSGYNIGDKILCKYSRVPSDAEDTYGSDWVFMQCALHAPINSNGSRQRYVK
jgi:hypothetical protein